jgi:ATP-dependent Lon protease
MKVINEELNRFLGMDKHHSEIQVSRTYLEYLTCLPYGVSTEENFDIHLAKKTLDDTHYGMDDVKNRILEFIAVGKLKHSVQGKILCFVGPPGVGKTSIGESIASSLSRKFHRIALGGDRDTSTLKGFRRTYVGAVPGKIVRALKTTEVENPVLLIDEVDKIGQRSVQGDPGSALLEILDPEQNNNFTDDFLDVPIDLSKVLFLCTANSLDNLHPALLDRMEIIHIAGYTHNEKRHILDKYLLPQAIKNAGILNSDISFTITNEVKDYIIHNYCREPGVRSLKKYFNKISEKMAYQMVDNPEGIREIKVDIDNIEKYIGHAIYKSSKIYSLNPPSVSLDL